VKISDIHACTHELIGGGKVRISLIKLGSLRCLIHIGMEHDGECSHERLTEAVNDMIYALILTTFDGSHSGNSLVSV
jgi:hypothetical protein